MNPVAVGIPVLLLLLSAVTYQHFAPVSVSDSDYRTHLTNKAVLLCDVTSGIGEELAYELAAKGAKMLLVARTGRSESLLMSLRDGKLASPQAQLQISARTLPTLLRIKDKALELGSPQVEVYSWDFGNVTGSHTLVDMAVELLGGLDYLVLNHAEYPRGNILEFQHHQTPHFIDRSFRVNVFSFIEIALRAMPYLEKSKGHIFVTSSIVGEISNAGLPVFAATKHALNGFFYSLQQELLAKKSAVTLSIGALGVVWNDGKTPLYELAEWMMGDLTECARGIMDSLVSHPRTFTYPKIHPYMARFSWYFLHK